MRLSRLAGAAGVGAEICAKLEFFNPMHSFKDRFGVAMLDDLAAAGRIGPGSTIVEPSSGNTGIGLAFVCAARGYRLILVMPDSMSIERRKMLALLGVQLELTESAQGMPRAIKRAEELLVEIEDAVMPRQFENPSNPRINVEATAEEIWVDTGGVLDAFVCGVRTGGTLTGVGRVLKARKPDFKIVAVEPEDSPVLSGGVAGPHKIQGIGAGFVPWVLDTGLIDRVLTISNQTAIDVARKLAVIEGIPAGISSGAAVTAALELAASAEFADSRIVVVLPSFADGYLSTALFDGL